MAATEDSQPRKVILSWVLQHPSLYLRGQSFVAVPGSNPYYIVKQCITTPKLKRPYHGVPGLFCGYVVIL